MHFFLILKAGNIVIERNIFLVSSEPSKMLSIGKKSSTGDFYFLFFLFLERKKSLWTTEEEKTA